MEKKVIKLLVATDNKDTKILLDLGNGNRDEIIKKIEDVLKESTLCSTSEDAFPETVAVFSLTLPEAFNCEEVRSSSQASR